MTTKIERGKNMLDEFAGRRPGLPPLPARMRRLPIERGYPVPWFVDMVDGHYDFRIQDGRKRARALIEHRCWLCGDFIGVYLAFVIGPMCAVNQISSEPPSHRECAEYAVRACPFLTLQEPERRTNRLPDEVVDAPGCPINRNPGVALVWITKQMYPFPCDGDYLVKMGEPDSISFWHKGRPATRAEILESIETGLPILREAAAKDGPIALAKLAEGTARALALLPAA